jgi:ABC-type Zn uptake system ZnuABC Zn-binding protein ZnuA
VRRDPANASYYNQNYDALKGRIEKLDAAIKQAVETIPAENRKLLTYHDSFPFFGPRYGFEIIGAIQPSDFGEPSAKEVADLIVQIRQAEVPAIFGSEVFPSPVLEQIAKESGARFVDAIRDDDLPGQPGDATHSYLQMMVDDVVAMTDALGGDSGVMMTVDTTNVPGADAAVSQPQ